jgi:hypothetical protein
MDYHNVAQGKLTIPNIDDGEECQLTDVRRRKFLEGMFFKENVETGKIRIFFYINLFEKTKSVNQFFCECLHPYLSSALEILLCTYLENSQFQILCLTLNSHSES